MKTRTLFTTIALTAFVAAAVLSILATSFTLQRAKEANAAGFVQTVTLPYAATTTGAVAVTSSTRVLATTTNNLGNGTSYERVYASICNPSSNPVYLNMNLDKPADQTHAVAVIAAAAGYQACYEVTDRNLYQGSIQASSTNQTSTSVLVTDFVY